MKPILRRVRPPGVNRTHPASTAATRRRPSPLRTLAIQRERRLWDRRADSWDAEGSAGLTKVVDAVLDACEPSAGMVAIDLGCGSGQVTIPLARRCERVLGVDVSPRSIERQKAKCVSAEIINIETLAEPLEALDLPAATVDLVVSNYALHHLGDVSKAELLASCLRWLRPGGRLVVGDMMLGRGGAAADRRIVMGKLSNLVRRGPGGWWRIAKNVWRFGLRVREKPLSRSRWEALARTAGFVEVRTVPIVAEAAILLATRPRTSAEPAAADARRDAAGERRPIRPAGERPRHPPGPVPELGKASL